MVEKRQLVPAAGGLAALLVLAGQVLATALRAPGPLETALFATLQLVIVGFAAYSLAREASERTFLASQKRRGYGALRRIREVGDTLGRLEAVVQRKKEVLARSGKVDPALTAECLEHVLSVAAELGSKVAASREDWQEVFEDELRRLRDLEGLRARWRAEKDPARRQLLEQQARELWRSLPVSAQALAGDFGGLLVADAEAGGWTGADRAAAAGEAAGRGAAAARVRARGDRARDNGARREAAPVA